MNQTPRHLIGLAACLSMLAGYVDALGFIGTGGAFVSFMSGNSTRFGVGLVREGWAFALAPLVIIALFVAGVVAGTLIGQRSVSGRMKAILSFVTLMLAVAALCGTANALLPAIACMAVAMGAANTLFERNGEVSIAITYMTGTLVRMGQRLAGAFTGGPRWAWTPYCLLWFALISGAALGGFSYTLIGLHALWAATLFSAILTIIGAKMEHTNRQG